VKRHYEIVWMLRVFLWLFALLIACAFGTLGSAAQAGRALGPNVPPAQSPKGTVGPAATGQPGLPVCPVSGLAPSQQSNPGIGHHRVILSWHPSPRSSNDASNAVGYCLYRSKTEKAVEEKPPCSDCEQINLVPVVNTTCLDDLVEDNTRYYYVVTAINLSGRLSSPSNAAPAAIPPGTQTVSAPLGSPSLPACRGVSSTR
jgi:hypothetical protein